MSRDINNCTFSGNLVRDPELRVTQSGNSVTNFTIAFNRSTKQGDEWVDKPVFIDCTAWKGLAEFVNDACEKGTRVLVRGPLDQEKWETKDGQKRHKHVIMVNEFELISRGKKDKAKKKDSEEEVKQNDLEFGEVPF